jgi:hypothetical protein
VALPINPGFQPIPFNMQAEVKDVPGGRLLLLSFVNPSTIFELALDAAGYQKFMADLESHRTSLESGIVQPLKSSLIIPQANGHSFRRVKDNPQA